MGRELRRVPPFETKEKLIEYLTTKGDFWKQSSFSRYGELFKPYTKAAAEYLVDGGYAPSMVITSVGGITTAQDGAQALCEMQKTKEET